MSAQLDTFQTLADPTRCRIVNALRHGEQQVNDLVARAGIHQSGVSRHLRILHDAGFVALRPDGQRRLYSLRPERFRELDRWLAQYRKLWETRLDRFGEAPGKKRSKPKLARRNKIWLPRGFAHRFTPLKLAQMASCTTT